MKHFLAVLGLLLALNCAPAFAADSGLCEKLFKSASDFCKKDFFFPDYCAELEKGLEFFTKQVQSGQSQICKIPFIGFLCKPCEDSGSESSKPADALNGTAPAADAAASPAVRSHHKRSLPIANRE